MFKKIVFTAIIFLLPFMFGFAPGCGINVTEIEYYIQSSAKKMDIEYRDITGEKKLLQISNFPWDFTFQVINVDPYIKATSVIYADDDTIKKTEIHIDIDKKPYSYGYCEDPNDCEIELF
ncbi:MAG: hypothetical protein ABIH39_06770 [Candidatus Margulisiibacteriota bacterium]